MDLITAFATNNGTTFMDNHFGDANYYDIYKISASNSEFIKRIDNTVDIEEESHADPKKAKGISGLLKSEGIQVVVSKVFGPNIKRIKKNFVCIIISKENISQSITHIQQKFDVIVKEWEKGEERLFLKF